MTTPHTELTILMPCLNEAETLAVCIDKAKGYLDRSGVSGEVLIADNGSTDGSQEIARSHGARVVDVPVKGYGAALIGGTEAAAGKYVIMGDADDSYDFTSLDPFLERLRAGDDLVMGNRFLGGIEPGAMPPLHKYWGNPVLTWIGRVLFRSPIRDFHCGLRGYNRQSILDLELCTTGMEYASEMVVKSTLAGLQVSEVPTTLSKDGRSRPPHLRSWRDGWRHLRFLLIFSPNWLFLVPGIIALILGLAGSLLLLLGPASIGPIGLDTASQVYLAALATVGYQSVLFGVLTKMYAEREGFRLPRGRNFTWLAKRMTLEALALVGLGLFLVGLVGLVIQLAAWGTQGYGPLDAGATVRVAVPAALMMSLGAQTVMAGLFLGILTIPTRSIDATHAGNVP